MLGEMASSTLRQHRPSSTLAATFVPRRHNCWRLVAGDDVRFSARQLPTGWWEAFDLVER